MTFPSWLVTLPACNEGGRLAKTVSKVDAVLQDLGLSYTLLVAEDGSTDGTFQVAQDLTSE